MTDNLDGIVGQGAPVKRFAFIKMSQTVENQNILQEREGYDRTHLASVLALDAPNSHYIY